MGLGLQGGGVGSALYFAKAGAQVTITDLKTKKQLESSLKLLKNYPFKYVLGRHNLADFLTSDLIVKNPDVSWDSGYIKKAQKKGIPIEMEESLFIKMSPSKIIGITGTRGKSTVSKLVYEVLKNNQKSVFLGGNMKGSRTLELLSQTSKKDWVVLELSSWQLSAFTKSPQISLVTNIYPDHLNRYGSMSKYIKDKKNIFRFQKASDYLLLNFENEMTKKFAAEAKSKVIFFKKNDWPKDWPLKILGTHNISNVAAVWKLAQLLGLDNEITRKTIQDFSGLNYRLQKVREVNGRQFINDSTSTTPIATIAAIKSFPPQSIILLLGGNDKSLPLQELLKEIKKSVKYVVLLKGSGTERLVTLLKKDPQLAQRFSPVFSDYRKAVKLASSKAKRGETVLLSPGFTSFAMFNNEFERAEKFNLYAQEL